VAELEPARHLTLHVAYVGGEVREGVAVAKPTAVSLMKYSRGPLAILQTSSGCDARSKDFQAFAPATPASRSMELNSSQGRPSNGTFRLTSCYD